MLFSGKIIRVTLTDDKGKILLETEKGFIMPKNLDADDDSILIIKGRGLPELEYNSFVCVITTSKSNDRVKYSGTVAMSMDTQLNIRLMKNNQSETLKERRRFFKIKVNEKGRALYYVRDEKTVRYDEPLPISIRDINQGGVFIVCDEDFAEGDMICVDLDLFVDVPFNAVVRVLRVQKSPEGEILGYGCEFQALTGAQSDIIGRFIYKEQLEARQREANKNNGF